MVDWTKGGDCASEQHCGELNAKYPRWLSVSLSLCPSDLPLHLTASLLPISSTFTEQVLCRTATPAARQPAVLVCGDHEHVRMGNTTSTYAAE